MRASTYELYSLWFRLEDLDYGYVRATAAATKRNVSMKNLNSRKSQVQAAFSMGLVFMLVGIPLWWKTTEVYRADLPYTEIQQLVDYPVLSTKVSLIIASFSERWVENAFSAFSKTYSTQNFDFVAVDYALDRQLVSEDNFANLISGIVDVKGVKFATDKDILLLINPSSGAGKLDIFVTRKRAVVINIPQDNGATELEKMAEIVMKFLNEKVVNTRSINDAVSKAYGAQLNIPKDREFHLRKTVQPDKGYDLLFSMLCPEPEKTQVTWDIQSATESYVSPMLAKLEGYADFHVGSQILYYSGLSVKPKKSKDADPHYYLTHQQLPHVVNPIESRLGAQMSPNPTLNFVIYNTEEKYTPLRIQHADGKYSTTNTFLIPRWGAIMIKNIQGANSSELPHKVELKSVEYMEVFVAQLRSLLGIDQRGYVEGASARFQDPDETGITDLELDYLVRARAAENIATAIHTVHSLAELLEKIKNIVINDKIAEHVYSAVREIKNAKNALKNSQLPEALKFSNLAFKDSEKAFFDPTLLELLYFPEDQKFAIYIPLFLPISLPLISSFVNAIKLFRAEKKGKQKSE